MKHFINLTTCVLNKLHVVEIVKKPNMYHIYMTNNHIFGLIEICEKEKKKDYTIITDWIRTIGTDYEK